MPAELKTIIANCLIHARRKFVQVLDYFEDECRHVIDVLSLVYQNDATTRNRHMTAEERLQYHQVHSGPAMEQLHVWLKDQLSNRTAEPHSSLGTAIKRAIIHRKNSLFYKTENGARVGDMLMSLIYTAELNGENPLDYLIALQQHSPAVQASPDAWLPWNYQETIAGPSRTNEQPDLQTIPP